MTGPDDVKTGLGSDALAGGRWLASHSADTRISSSPARAAPSRAVPPPRALAPPRAVPSSWVVGGPRLQRVQPIRAGRRGREHTVAAPAVGCGRRGRRVAGPAVLAGGGRPGDARGRGGGAFGAVAGSARQALSISGRAGRRCLRLQPLSAGHD